MNDSIFKAYFEMYKTRGWKLPFQYFLNNQLFDLINKTDTHQRLEKSNYLQKPNSFDEGILYMSCPTIEIKNHLNYLRKKLNEVFYEYQFIDLGCGKGKTIIIYLKLFGSNVKYKPIGIEYYKPLVNIAIKNMKVLSKKNEASFYHDDAVNFCNYTKSEKIIVFLYNPFGEKTLENVLKKLLSYKSAFIVYVDPVFDKLIRDFDFSLLCEKKGWFPNRFVKIYYKEIANK